MEGELEITMFAATTDSLIPNHWYYFKSSQQDVSMNQVFRSNFDTFILITFLKKEKLN